MWGGARTEYLRPLRVGSTITRETVVKDIYSKQGATGPLIFVILRHEIKDETGIAIVEEHDYFFRDPDQSMTKPPLRPAFGDAQWSDHFTADVNLLFRYSAITFNAHRIHFDRAYAKNVEHYPGAVVHGPLTATLLMDQCFKQVGRPIRRFEYRGVVPLFDGQRALLAGRLDADQALAWAANSDGLLAMSARVDFN
jgi:3-methylfumaryl-CoA hydratase